MTILPFPRPQRVSGGPLMARIGFMLYSARRACAEDFEATLRAVAAMGYDGVEAFDLHGHDVVEVRGWLDELELDACGLHAPLVSVEADIASLAATARGLGTDRLVVSWVSPPTSAAEVADIHARLVALAPAAAELGIRLGFHNHDAELRRFDGEPALLERLLAETPELFLELDLGWAWYAGVDPADLVTRAAGRVPLVHIKDFRTRETPSFCPVGDGASGTSMSCRRRSPPASNGCSSSRTRSTARSSTPPSARSPRSRASSGWLHERPGARRCGRLRRDQPAVRAERARVRGVRRRRLRRPRPSPQRGAGARSTATTCSPSTSSSPTRRSTSC